jgi:maltose alpha-D-glucosyltransferase/alpha-amylase
MRDFLQRRCRDAILLAEANVPPDQSKEYLGAEGDRLQMMLNFPVNQRLWYALATGDIEPLACAIEQTADVPAQAQFVQFLRSHDECDLGRLSDEQRAKVFEQCGPDKSMQLYDRGIRRRLAPMLGGDRRRIELAFSLLFTLPGTPLIQYGDEIGIRDDLSLPERECARTAMQWSDEEYGGFSTAATRRIPIVDDAAHGYQRINVASQRRDSGSLLNWIERRIRARKELTQISWGECTVVRTGTPGVLVLRYVWRNTAVVTIYNLTGEERTVEFDVRHPDGGTLHDLFDDDHSRARADGTHCVTVRPYGHIWFRVGSSDPTLRQTPF